MQILGISGKAMHGKDTCALIAQEIAVELGMQLGMWAMAHPLKAIVYGEANGDHTFDDIWHTKPPQVRRALQLRGTEEGRLKFGESLWTLQSEAYLKLFATHFPIDGVVFTDIRFPNEVDFIRSGGVDPNVYHIRAFREELASTGWTLEKDGEQDPEDPVEFAALLDAEQAAMERANARTAGLIGTGQALYITSDRPTLTGEAAQHASETALDVLDLQKDFDGVINNDLDVTFDDLRDQLTPYVKRMFDL